MSTATFVTLGLFPIKGFDLRNKSSSRELKANNTVGKQQWD
tara:strand:- start:829 stop:951 length:123 start_codon:yes stop_codon:yes gene_type:complete